MSGKTLVQHERAIGEAIVARDVERLGRLTHASFSYLGSHVTGVLRQNRISWLQSMASIRTTSFLHSATDVQVFGTTAVVTVDGLWVGEYPGAPAQQHLLISDTWLKDARDAWKLVRRHASSVLPTEVGTRSGAPAYVEL